MDLYLIMATVVLLLCCSAFFSGSETALTAASKARLHQWERDGEARAGIVNRLRESKERLIGAILLGNNLVNILATTLATTVLTELAGPAGVAYATLVMTLLVLIFAEVLPKTYAVHHADRASLVVAPLLNVVVRVLAPITETVTRLVELILRLLGAAPKAGEDDTAEELRGAIELHRGSTEEESRAERNMLHSVLDLQRITVEEVMVHRRELAMLDADMPAKELVEAVLKSPYTRIPLYTEDSDNIIGVLHAKALLRALQAADGDYTKLDVQRIAADPWFIPNTTVLSDQLQAFRRRREHFALVVDEYGTVMGIVTLEDILEEIVGDISDEHDQPVVGVRPQSDGTLLVKGTVPIRDLNRRYDWRLPHDTYTTIAGLVLYEARRIPQVGQTYAFFGFTFTILRRQRHQITLLRVTPPGVRPPPHPRPPMMLEARTTGAAALTAALPPADTGLSEAPDTGAPAPGDASAKAADEPAD